MNSDNRLNSFMGYVSDIIREFPEVKAINFSVNGSVMSNAKSIAKIRNYLLDSKKFKIDIYLNGKKL